METKRKNKFFTNHSKSSAMVVSLTIHAVLLVFALSFVAVTVIQKEDKKFESKLVNRPRLPPKKLQVPVKIKKQQRKPKLRQRIVVKQKINRNMPDIKMPEITGIKGGLGAAGGAGLGGAGGIGFSMPEVKVFGVRSKGEKVFLALDSDAIIMRDEVGGMRAYMTIKDELAKIIEGLSPTTLFNLAVFDHGTAVLLFPRMVPATRENTSRVRAWLESLNKVSAGMGSNAYGVKTIGEGGTRLPATGVLARGKLQKDEIARYGQYWYRPMAEAMLEQADTIFLLSGWWGVVRHAIGEWPEWSDAKRKKWEEEVQKALAKQEEENKKRAAIGEPPQVLRDHHALAHVYFPGKFESLRKPEPEWHLYTGKDFADALHILRKETVSNLPVKSGISKKKKDRFSLNVVYFAPKDTGISATQEENFQRLTSLCHGKFRVIAGLEAIKSSVSEAGD